VIIISLNSGTAIPPTAYCQDVNQHSSISSCLLKADETVCEVSLGLMALAKTIMIPLGCEW
jgi:hypothetical protein